MFYVTCFILQKNCSLPTPLSWATLFLSFDSSGFLAIFISVLQLLNIIVITSSNESLICLRHHTKCFQRINLFPSHKNLLNCYGFLLLFKYSCLHFSTTTPNPTLLTPTIPPWSYRSLALSMCPLNMFLDDSSLFSSLISLLTPLWLLSVCFLIQCLWLYFDCLFVLLIMFLL